MKLKSYLSRIILFLVLAFGILNTLGAVVGLFSFTFIPSLHICKAFFNAYCKIWPSSSLNFFLGIPVPLLESFFLISTILLIPLRQKSRTSRTAFLQLWLFVGTVFSIVYLLVMYFSVRKLIGFPFLTQVSIILAFIISMIPFGVRSWGRAIKSFFKERFYSLSVNLIFLVMLVLLVFFGKYNKRLYSIVENKDRPVQDYYVEWENRDLKKIEVPDGTIELALTPADFEQQKNKLHVVEFLDFECTSCLTGLKEALSGLGSLSNKIRFSLVHFPLSSDCNTNLSSNLHNRACDYAEYFLKDGNNRSDDRVFKRRLIYPHEKYEKVFPNIRHFSQEEGPSDLLAAHVALGNSLEVRGTPVVYINGRLAGPFKNKKRLIQLIRHILFNEEKKVLDNALKPHLENEKYQGMIDSCKLPVYGNPDAEHVLVEYSSMHCAYSRKLLPDIQELQKNGKVSIKFKLFPLRLNDMYEFQSRLLLAAAETADRDQAGEVYVGIKDLLFGIDIKLPLEKYKEETFSALDTEGYDVKALQEIIDSKDVTELYFKNIADAYRNGVRGTPTLFIDGKLYRGSRTAEDILSHIDSLD